MGFGSIVLDACQYVSEQEIQVTATFRHRVALEILSVRQMSATGIVLSACIFLAMPPVLKVVVLPGAA